MFKCQSQSCNLPDGQVPHRQPVNRIVTERRRVTYEKKVRKGRRVVGVEEITGWEIVTEILCCPRCFRILTGQQPRLVHTPPPKKKKYQGFSVDIPKRNRHHNHRQDASTPGKKHKRPPRKTNKTLKVEKVNPVKIVTD